VNNAKKLSLIIGGLLAIVLTGCSSGPIRAIVPSDPETYRSTEPGKFLMAMGYTPAVELSGGLISDGKNAPDGVAYIACGDDTNITDCADDIHNRGTTDRPVIYVENGKVVTLEGPHFSWLSDNDYRVAVPDTYADFGNLVEQKKTDLITKTMSAVMNALPDPSTKKIYSIKVDNVGMVNARIEG